MKEGEEHYFKVHEKEWLVYQLRGQQQVIGSLTE